MCRSIKTLRPPYTEAVTEDDMQAAALQYVRKISGFRAPAARNAAAFDEAVAEIAASTARLLAALEVRSQGGHQHAGHLHSDHRHSGPEQAGQQHAGQQPAGTRSGR
jgi:hypothetical protein